MSELARILIADDNPKYLQDALPMYGYEVIVATDGVQALKILSKTDLKETPIDLILLDIMMPNMNGWDTLKSIRSNEKTKHIPVIMLTAINEEQKMVSGLKIGADDYIVKPFSARELIARIKAVLRRISAEPEAEGKTIRLEDLEISLSNYEVKIKGKPVDFTPKEVEILYLLASHPNRVFDREQILSKIWGYDYFGDTRAVDTQIKRIRQKIPDEGLSWGIRTVYGVGYKFGASDS